MISLGEDISGEHVVCEHCCRSHEDFVGDDEVLIHERSMDAVLIRITKQSVIPESEERLHWIRVTRLHGSKDRRWVRHVTTHHDICILVPVSPLSCLFKHFLRPIGVSRMQIRPKLLRFLFVAKELM